MAVTQSFSFKIKKKLWMFLVVLLQWGSSHWNLPLAGRSEPRTSHRRVSSSFEFHWWPTGLSRAGPLIRIFSVWRHGQMFIRTQPPDPAHFPLNEWITAYRRHSAFLCVCLACNDFDMQMSPRQRNVSSFFDNCWRCFVERPVKVLVNCK